MKYPIRILSNKEGAIMGLLNKLKNVLFEEEEIEIPETEVKEEPKLKEVPKKKEPVKMTFESDEDDIISDRELFKAEPTFNFPVFDEQEFDSVKKEEKIQTPVYHTPVSSPKTRVKSSTAFDVEPGRSRVTEPRRDYKEPRKPREVTPIEKRKFSPSPVISPVYGVLDKNYKKEDIVVRKEEKKVIDVDSVRKKAFGTLEDDIEKSLATPSRDFYANSISEEQALDDLLSATTEVIPVSNVNEEPKLEYPSFNINEEPVRSYNEPVSELEVLDRPVKKTVEEKLEDDTLENDLFDLIDSMYENREDGE